MPKTASKKFLFGITPFAHDADGEQTLTTLAQKFEDAGEATTLQQERSLLTVFDTESRVAKIVGDKANYFVNSVDIKEGGSGPLTRSKETEAGYVGTRARKAAKLVANDFKLG